MSKDKVLPITLTVSVRAEGKAQASTSMELEITDYDGRDFKYQVIADTAMLVIQQSFHDAEVGEDAE